MKYKLGKLDRSCSKCEYGEECEGTECKYKEKKKNELNFDR